MNPVYIDIHIHTSENPDNLITDYDIDCLFSKVRAIADGQPALISLTDHNTINKDAYLKAKAKCGEDIHLLLGVELHIHYVKDTDAYHCHMFFKNEVSEDNINKINKILDTIYKQKRVDLNSKDIPLLDEVINKFDSFDFVLLPHGGQSHATFNSALPPTAKLDTMLERSVYYNQFDGFTARGEKGRGKTDKYFQKLGINEIVNLVTCSDNYSPNKYPSAKDKKAQPFIPSWMFAEPTFEGFRLSLSERSRLVYSEKKPEAWSEIIESVKFKGPNLDIDVEFSAGLNVVIGGSSSGKTLLVDSIYRIICGKGFEDDEAHYNEYNVKDINIINPSLKHPHYLNQNYIMQVVGNDDNHKIEDIEIVRRLFPDNKEEAARVQRSLAVLKQDLSSLIQTVRSIKSIEEQLEKTSHIGRLLVLKEIKKNYLKLFVANSEIRGRIKYDKIIKDKHVESLSEIKMVLLHSPFVADRNALIDELIVSLQKVYRYSEMEKLVYEQSKTLSDRFDTNLRMESQEDQTKTQELNKVVEYTSEYIYLFRRFKNYLNRIARYDEKIESSEITAAGHHLYISNQFKLNKDTVLEVFNKMLKSDKKIKNFDDILPENLYDCNFSKQRPKVKDYDDFVNKVYDDFVDRNKTIYKITTKDGRDFDKLSAGWKTSVLLDLILGYDQDFAPVIIDQPEDNLATKYINDGLVAAVKRMKKQKQIILVSHNATIPMMGDAQRIVYCKNYEGKIVIRSAPLEGEIDGTPVLDLIASITDGGKSSIKKRVKKYNLKKFIEINKI